MFGLHAIEQPYEMKENLLMGLGNVAYNKLKDICLSLGKHNDALYAVLAIAMFKGIMRPTFTMMDKESDKETKKYAAFREGLTEVIAFCSYIATHNIILPLAVPLAKKAKVSPKKVKNGLSLVSVCLTAGLIIPAVCNVTLKPIMNGITKLSNKKEQKNNGLDIKEKAVTPPAASVFSPKLSENSKQLLVTIHKPNMQNSSMKVGG